MNPQRAYAAREKALGTKPHEILSGMHWLHGWQVERVIRALLALQNLERRWTQREMQKHCRPNASLGLVNKVVRYLRDEAFIEELTDGGFRLRDPQKLLFVWRDVYRFERHERRSYFTLLQGKRLHDALAKLGAFSKGLAIYAAFSAADLQAPHVRQPKTWLYVNEREIANFEKLLEAKPVDFGENLVVLIPDDDGIFYLPDGSAMREKRMACTNVVQTYIDLSHGGGRGRSVAGAAVEARMESAKIVMNPEPRSENDYSPRQVEAARRVLVDVGQVLASFADYLVVVGG